MLRIFVLLAILAGALACGPSGPSGTGSGGSGGGGGGTSGGGGGGGGTSGGGGGGTPSGATPSAGGSGAGWQTAVVKRMGGAGIEWTQDVAFAPDGSIVAFNVIGVDGDRLQQIGFVHMDRDGNELQAEVEDEGGRRLGFVPAGSFVVAPSGHLVLAATGACDGAACPTLGGAPVNGGAVVVLDARARLVWSRPLPGEVLSNVDVDAAGEILVAARVGAGAALRKYDRDGNLAWEQDVALGPGATVALDGGGNVYYAAGATLAKLDAAGHAAWQQQLGGDAALAAVRGDEDGVVVTGSFRGDLALAGGTLSVPDGADHGWFVAAVAGDGSARWARRIDSVQETGDDGVKTRLAIAPGGLVAVVTGADACTAVVHAYDASGALLWERPLAANGCDGRGVVVNGVAATAARVAVAGAISGDVDFGTGTVSPQATDGFVVVLRP
jgi:hypothetical protein